ATLHTESPLFPYTTLFRSRRQHDDQGGGAGQEAARYPQRYEPTQARLRGKVGVAMVIVFMGMRVSVSVITVMEVGSGGGRMSQGDRKSTRLNSSHQIISYA